MAVRYLDDGNDDGTNFGQSSSSKIGFYGLTTPIIQPALTAAVSTTAASASTGSVYGYTTQAQADGIIELLNLIRTRLVAIGLFSE